MREWRKFVHQKQLDLTRIGTDSHLLAEFDYLEEFGEQQFHRRRPYIKGMDHDPRWTPFLENKITLQDGTEMSASFIEFSSFHQPNYHNFIASQSPQKTNLHLFWQMIWERKLNQIVMVTELKEPKAELCPLYWPEKLQGKLVLDNGLEVTLVKEESLLAQLKDHIQIRTFHLRYKNQVRQVVHYWYRNWMDKTAPQQVMTLLTLIKTVNQQKKKETPILVHCHAGVGRTGTFIALYHMVQRNVLGDTPISLFECVGHMRWQRPKLVGNPIQYRFCHGFLRNLQMQWQK